MCVGERERVRARVCALVRAKRNIGCAHEKHRACTLCEEMHALLQCVAVCCSVLHSVETREHKAHTSILEDKSDSAMNAVCCSVLQCVAACCSVLQFVAVCCSVLQCVAVCVSLLQCITVRCSVVQLTIRNI